MDVQNCFEQLRTVLRKMKYSVDIDTDGLLRGCTGAYFNIIHRVLSQHSHRIAAHLCDRGYDVFAKRGRALAVEVYRLVRDEWQYHPVLTVDQMMKPTGYVGHKLTFVVDVCELVRRLDARLARESSGGR